MLSGSIADLLKSVREQVSSVVGVAVLHKSGLLVAKLGFDEGFWIRASALLNSVGQVAEVLGSAYRGVDVVFDDYYLVIRAGSRIVVALVARPDVELELLDVLAFRLVEDLEKDFLGLQ